MKCNRCGFDYKFVNLGCVHKTGYFDNGMFYEPIKVGDPEDEYNGGNNHTRCSDCGAPIGTYHHFGCHKEKCPICFGNILRCGCFSHSIIEKT